MDFPAAFTALTGHAPFTWQGRLFSDYFCKGDLPAALDLPTGLGKTSVMAIWLIARATGPSEAGRKLPRRLVYVVDRRAVVDQATAEAEKLRANLDGAARELKQALGLAGRSLPISTLRGQFVDNREWLADPAAPAIIIGTVDMIGSRLLFEGYGVSRKSRPYHAGLLGADALIVLDEAHLVPPFENLIDAIETGQQADYEADSQKALGPRSADDRNMIPRLRLLSLSATGRERSGKVFRLKDKDREDALVKQRLDARKTISIKTLQDTEKLENALASAAWELANDGANPIKCLIYCDSRDSAKAVFDNLAKCAGVGKKSEPAKAEIEFFTGARRFFERETTSKRLAEPLGFFAGNANRVQKPVFLVATSAAEVGVDLDADHMVCDLVAWERVVQRLGRVNRRGDGEAKIIVIDTGEPKPTKDKNGKEKKPEDYTDAEKRALLNYKSLEIIRQLPTTAGGDFDASPAALLDLKRRAGADETLRAAIEAATTPAPLRPALTRALVDAWSMTSLDTHAGRPEIAPWLRGWGDEDRPQTSVVWRAHLPVRKGGDEATPKEVASFFEAAPPHISEKLDTKTCAVVDWLIDRAAMIMQGDKKAKGTSEAVADNSAHDETPLTETDDILQEKAISALKADDIIAFALTPARDLRRVYRLKDFNGEKKDKQALRWELALATLVIDARFGGLSDGLLDQKALGLVRTVDDGGDWLSASPSAKGRAEPLIKFRVRPDKGEGAETESNDNASLDSDWHKPFIFVKEISAEGSAIRSLIVEKWRSASTKEEERSVSNPQSLAEHQSWTKERARAIAAGVGLDGNYAEALAIAARLHDEGKRAKRWQRAFNANQADATLDRPLAKTKGPIDFRLLDGYRHEFGSLPYAQKDEALKRLPEPLQDLVLHLIAAHHGGARPIIETRSCDDAPPSALHQRACDVALRFARLQKQWGPWGLAWWEALLRAADQQASRKNDEAGAARGERGAGGA